MDATAVSEEIREIRARLGDIDEARAQLPENAFNTRVDLLDEEHRLQSRLGELRDLAAKAGAGFAQGKASAQTDLTRKASAQTDLTRTPTLPKH
ncbi:MAG: hypothetical protein WAL25_02415 [Acidimicrobiia bacterium]